MAAIPLGHASYKREDLPTIVMRNLYYEAAPSSPEDQVSLHPRPRLQLFANIGAGPITGLYRKGGVMATAGFSGKILCVSGGTLYRVDQTTGAPTSLGSVTGSFSRMTAEGTPDVVVLTQGGVLYSTDGATLSTVTMPAGYQAYAVDTLNSYFLVCSDVGQFFWSAIGGTTIDPLDFATAESQPDVLMTLKVIGDELWLLGRLSIEVWQPTGDLNLPFQRIGGRIFGIGITARDTCQKLNVGGVDKIIWLGTDRRIYMTNPNPQKISDAAMDERLAKATISQADNSVNPYAVIYPWNGHDFYVLNIPGQGSFAYDLLTGLWDEVTSYGHPQFRGAVSALNPNNQPMVGDDTSGAIWTMVDTQDTDGSDPVVFEWTGLIDVPNQPQRCNSVRLDCATGTTTDTSADPMVQMTYSDDMGNAWESAEDQSLGRQGERNLRVMWERLGQLSRPCRLLKWRTTTPTVIRKAKVNETVR